MFTLVKLHIHAVIFTYTLLTSYIALSYMSDIALSLDSNPLSIIQPENLLLYQAHKQNEIQFKKSAHNIYN